MTVVTYAFFTDGSRPPNPDTLCLLVSVRII